MSFAHPLMAAISVLAIGVPVVLHLLRRRRKPVRWGAMRFVLEAQRRTRQRLTLEQLLLLIARCVLIGLAGLAIARPLLAGAGGLSGRRPITLAIVLDDGIVSGLSGEGGETTLDRLKTEAEDLLAGLDPSTGDRALLVLAGSPPRAVIAEPTSDLDAVSRMVAAAEPTSAESDLKRAIDLALESINAGSASDSGPASGSASGPGGGGGDGRRSSRDRVGLAVLSGFRGSRATLAESLAASPIDRLYATSPEPDEVGNVAVASVSPTRRVRVAGDPASQGVRVELIRFGDLEPRDVEVVVEASPADGPAAEVARGVVRFARGAVRGGAVLAGDVLQGSSVQGGGEAGGGVGGEVVLRATVTGDALPLDDRGLWPIGVRERLRIALAGETGSPPRAGIDEYGSAAWIDLALTPDARTRAGLDVSWLNARSISTGRISGLDVLMLTAPAAVSTDGWRAIGNLVASGALLVITPDASGRPQTWSDAFATALDLPWTLSREPSDVDASLAVGVTPGPLRFVASELEELAPAARVRRLHTVDTRGVGSVPLTVGGEPFLVTTRAGRTGSGRGGGSGGAELGRTESIGDESGLDGSGAGVVAMFSSALTLDWTDLPAQPLMVPLFQELVREGVAEAGRASVRVAGEPSRLPAGVVELRPLERGAVIEDGVVRSAGVYRGLRAGGQRGPLLAFNPSAGDTSPAPREAVTGWLSGLGSTPAFVGEDADAAGTQDDGTGRSIARLLLLIAVVAALAEVVLAGRLSSSTGTLIPWDRLRAFLGFGPQQFGGGGS
ncbi:MAG: BatA domain-containing protein [Planctomycetota bacterium]